MDDEHQFVQFQSAIESNIHLFMLSSETQPCPVTVGIELKYILGSLSPFLCCLYLPQARVTYLPVAVSINCLN